MPAPAVLAAPAALKVAGWAVAGAAVALAAARARRREGPRPEAEEAALDALPDGLDLAWAPEAGRTRSDLRGRWARVLRLGTQGPGIAVDFAAIARLRVAPIPAGAPAAAPGRRARR